MCFRVTTHHRHSAPIPPSIAYPHTFLDLTNYPRPKHLHLSKKLSFRRHSRLTPNRRLRAQSKEVGLRLAIHAQVLVQCSLCSRSRLKSRKLLSSKVWSEVLRCHRQRVRARGTATQSRWTLSVPVGSFQTPTRLLCQTMSRLSTRLRETRSSKLTLRTQTRASFATITRTVFQLYLTS